MPGEMKTVYRAGSLEEADIIVAWLNAQGIPALDLPAVYTPLGIEVCVPDPEQAQRAVAALTDHYKRQSEANGPVRLLKVLCEECGKTSSFPYAQRGLVQRCPHCGAHIDVLDETDVNLPDTEAGGDGA